MLLWLLGVFIVAQASLAADLTAKIYEQGSDPKAPLFFWKRTTKIERDILQVNVSYTQPDNQEAVLEEAQIKNGKIVKYSLNQRQLNEQGSAEIRDGKIHFTYTRGGKTETATEDFQENFVIAPYLIDYLIRHRTSLFSGQKVKVRFAVLDRLETIGFSFSKVEEKKLGDIEVVVLKMSPTSLIIAALVDSLYFTLRRDNFRTIRLLGRSLPKRNVNGTWTDLDADVIYD